MLRRVDCGRVYVLGCDSFTHPLEVFREKVKAEYVRRHAVDVRLTRRGVGGFGSGHGHTLHLQDDWLCH